MAINVGQRHVKDTPRNNMLYALDKARDLSVHTMKICSNKNIFTEEYSYITQKVVDTSLNIYMDAKRANDIKVISNGDAMRRLSLQDAAVSECDELFALIELSKRLFHLKSKKVNYWIALTEETKHLLIKWKEADYKRYFQQFIDIWDTGYKTRNLWLRSANVGNPCGVWCVSSNGYVYYANAYGPIRVQPIMFIG